MIRATFVMEQHIGHRAFYQNLHAGLADHTEIAAHWVEVTYEAPGSLWARWPALPAALRGALIGRAQARRGLRQNPCDVAVFNTQVPAALAGRAASRQPYILCTDITPLQYDEMSVHYQHQPDRNKWLQRYKFRVNQNLFKHAARLLPWSAWTRDSLVQDYGVDPARTEVLPPGVDLRLWQPGPASPSDLVRILFVGGDLYRKGGEMLLEAFRRLPPGSAELALVTRTPLAPAEGVRTYHDLQPNSAALIALYQSSQVFVLPTHAEAFGIAAVEASAAGLAVIATRVGGLTDIVQDGKTGFLIPAGDVDSLSQRLASLVAEAALRQDFGRAARSRAEAHFDARKNAARLANILQEVITGETDHA